MDPIEKMVEAKNAELNRWKMSLREQTEWRDKMKFVIWRDNEDGTRTFKGHAAWPNIAEGLFAKFKDDAAMRAAVLALAEAEPTEKMIAHSQAQVNTWLNAARHDTKFAAVQASQAYIRAAAEQKKEIAE